jgi:hypothetical protein
MLVSKAERDYQLAVPLYRSERDQIFAMASEAGFEPIHFLRVLALTPEAVKARPRELTPEAVKAVKTLPREMKKEGRENATPPWFGVGLCVIITARDNRSPLIVEHCVVLPFAPTLDVALLLPPLTTCDVGQEALSFKPAEVEFDVETGAFVLTAYDEISAFDMIADAVAYYEGFGFTRYEEQHAVKAPPADSAAPKDGR